MVHASLIDMWARAAVTQRETHQSALDPIDANVPGPGRLGAGGGRAEGGRGMAAEGMQFSWRWNGGMVSLNLGVIWGMSVQINIETIEGA
jgi:hypothetical protein